MNVYPHIFTKPSPNKDSWYFKNLKLDIYNNISAKVTLCLTSAKTDRTTFTPQQVGA